MYCTTRLAEDTAAAIAGRTEAADQKLAAVASEEALGQKPGVNRTGLPPVPRALAAIARLEPAVPAEEQQIHSVKVKLLAAAAVNRATLLVIVSMDTHCQRKEAGQMRVDAPVLLVVQMVAMAVDALAEIAAVQQYLAVPSVNIAMETPVVATRLAALAGAGIAEIPEQVDDAVPKLELELVVTPSARQTAADEWLGCTALIAADRQVARLLLPSDRLPAPDWQQRFLAPSAESLSLVFQTLEQPHPCNSGSWIPAIQKHPARRCR